MIGFLDPFPQWRMRIEHEDHPTFRIDLSEILIRQSRKGGRERFALPRGLQRVVISHSLPPAGDRVIDRHGHESIGAEDDPQCRECGKVRGASEAKIIYRPVQSQRRQEQAEGGTDRAKCDQKRDIAMDVMSQFMREHSFDLIR